MSQSCMDDAAQIEKSSDAMCHIGATWTSCVTHSCWGPFWHEIESAEFCPLLRTIYFIHTNITFVRGIVWAPGCCWGLSSRDKTILVCFCWLYGCCDRPNDFDAFFHFFFVFGHFGRVCHCDKYCFPDQNFRHIVEGMSFWGCSVYVCRMSPPQIDCTLLTWQNFVVPISLTGGELETSQNFGARPACGSFDLGVRRRPKTASGVASVENQRLAVLEIDSPHYFLWYGCCKHHWFQWKWAVCIS